MEKLPCRSPNFTNQNISKILKMFPNCKTEIKDKNGNLIPAIDFELLKQELTDNIVDGSEERYRLDWPGKQQSLIDANTPITKTLRPVRKQSKDFDTTENLFIEGDNLEALKLLQNTYLNQVKMIYIDPPYNTGKDFLYKDNFTQKLAEWKQQSGDYDEEGNRLVLNTESNGRFHSDWLSMMYPRLKLASNLLRDDGVIFISIDDNEQANLKKLCDEVFGEKNFVSQLIWTNKEGGGGGDSKYFKIKHEYILVYAKQKDNLVIEGVAIEDEDRYSLQDNYFKKRGKYQLVKLDSASIQRSKSLIYPITSPDNTKIFPSGCWRWSNKKVEWGIKEGFIEIKKNKTNNWSVYSKQYLKVDNEDRPMKRNKRQFGVIDKFSTTQSNRKLIDLFGNVYFKYTKPVELINLLTQISCNNSDIILDFFSGSATTAHAVMQLNAEDGGKRKFIMVQLPEECDKASEAFKAGYKTIADIAKERIRRAGEKIKQ